MDLSKEYLDEKFDRIFDRFDGVDDKMKNLESEVKKIEAQGNEMRDRVVRLETKHESLQNEVSEMKKTHKSEITDVFNKIRSCKTEQDGILDTKIENANNKQNLAIIAKSVMFTSLILGIIATIAKLAGVL